jgi:predicted dehydrogenase
MNQQEIRIGIVGAGGFAKFAMQAFAKLPQLCPMAVTDINLPAAKLMGAELGLSVYETLDALLQAPGIDLVYIASPPAFHYLQSKQSLLAGKHVICEKPAAITTAEAIALSALAQSANLLYVVNLMQRYNPIFTVVKTIVDENVLGKFLHGFFENYASDEMLGPEHWFWDISKSGGIFIEHGVHFFDLFEGWLGKGDPVSAIQMQRKGQKGTIIDRVQATVLYKDGFVNFYHGFDQPKNLDRQEMRLLFEHGEITMYEWVPVKLKLHGLVDKASLARLQEITVELTLIHQSGIAETNHLVKGRFKDIPFDEHITLEYAHVQGKQQLYQEMLTAMITDQCAWIKDKTVSRMIDSSNAIASLAVAEQATQMATIIQ